MREVNKENKINFHPYYQNPLSISANPNLNNTPNAIYFIHPSKLPTS